MYSAYDTAPFGAVGCPIRKSPDQSFLSSSPKLIAARRVLRRLRTPRHPPHALSSLTKPSTMDRSTVTGVAQETSFEIESRLHIQLSKSIVLIRRQQVVEHSKTSCCPECSTASCQRGGAEGVRTLDIQLAKLALSQLSYSPSLPSVGPGGVEPPTSRLSGVRSRQLSYEP